LQKCGIIIAASPCVGLKKVYAVILFDFFINTSIITCIVINYLPILILFIVAVGFAVTNVSLSAILGKQKPSVEKLSPYECGIEPIGSARERFSVKFYLIAMLFVIFDVEVIFIYPWAVAFKSLKVFGFVEMVIFIGILFICYFYIWKRGGLEWD